MAFEPPKRPSPRGTILAILSITALLTLAGCGASKDGKAGQDRGTPEVGYRVMQPATVPIVAELPGRLAASRSAEMRPQITGVIQARLFTEGALVRTGQPLYRIDSSLYRASVAQAQANLASAQASASATAAKAARYKPLGGDGSL